MRAILLTLALISLLWQVALARDEVAAAAVKDAAATELEPAVADVVAVKDVAAVNALLDVDTGGARASDTEPAAREARQSRTFGFGRRRFGFGGFGRPYGFGGYGGFGRPYGYGGFGRPYGFGGYGRPYFGRPCCFYG